MPLRSSRSSTERNLSASLKRPEKKARDEVTLFQELCTVVKVLGDKVEKVVVSNRSTDSSMVVKYGTYHDSASSPRLVDVLHGHEENP
jgi:HSP90 family molecular chaperone